MPKAKKTVSGVGADAPTTTNAQGGKQSASPYRADLLPPFALLRVAEILKRGAAKYGENNWHQISVRDNVNHALVHLLAWVAGDEQDDHLGNACCRTMFALDSELTDREDRAASDSSPPPTSDEDAAKLLYGDQWKERLADIQERNDLRDRIRVMMGELPAPGGKYRTPARVGDITQAACGELTKWASHGPDTARVLGDLLNSVYVWPRQSLIAEIERRELGIAARLEIIRRGMVRAGELAEQNSTASDVPADADNSAQATSKPAKYPRRAYRVYLAGPISKPDTETGLLHNINQADDAQLLLMKAGYAPFNPMLSVWAGGAHTHGGRVEAHSCRNPVLGTNRGFASVGWGDWIAADLPWVEVSDAVLRLPGESKGADAECDHAKRCGVPVFNDLASLYSFFDRVDERTRKAEKLSGSGALRNLLGAG